jgi:hypothetical protein
MGWGEARRPPPPSRADLARELADALGEKIPEQVTAEKAWPVLIERVCLFAGYCDAADLGVPMPWPAPE